MNHTINNTWPYSGELKNHVIEKLFNFRNCERFTEHLKSNGMLDQQQKYLDQLLIRINSRIQIWQSAIGDSILRVGVKWSILHLVRVKFLKKSDNQDNNHNNDSRKIINLNFAFIAGKKILLICTIVSSLKQVDRGIIVNLFVCVLLPVILCRMMCVSERLMLHVMKIRLVLGSNSSSASQL